MIDVKDVFAGYGKEEILHGISFRAEEGKITTLIGSNGSGKSTLLKALLGLIPLKDGDIMIDGLSVREMARVEIARRIAYLPQGKNVPEIGRAHV